MAEATATSERKRIWTFPAFAPLLQMPWNVAKFPEVPTVPVVMLPPEVIGVDACHVRLAAQKNIAPEVELTQKAFGSHGFDGSEALMLNLARPSSAPRDTMATAKATGSRGFIN